MRKIIREDLKLELDDFETLVKGKYFSNSFGKSSVKLKKYK
jgi:hypothetical protein